MPASAQTTPMLLYVHLLVQGCSEMPSANPSVGAVNQGAPVV